MRTPMAALLLGCAFGTVAGCGGVVSDVNSSEAGACRADYKKVVDKGRAEVAAGKPPGPAVKDEMPKSCESVDGSIQIQIVQEVIAEAYPDQ